MFRVDRHAAALLVAVAAYSLLFSWRLVLVYQSGDALFDLAVYAQGFWNALGDPPFFYSLEGEMSRFGRHFSPVFYLILPLYLAWPSPAALLVFQSAAVGLGALPLYGLAAPRVGRGLALALALAYLLHPAVHDVTTKNEFHEISLAMPALLLLAYLAFRAPAWTYAAGLLLALATREEVAVTTALFGAYLVLAGRPRRGAATVAASLLWFGLAVRVVMPFYNAEGRFPLPEGYEYLGDSLGEVVRTALADPRPVLVEALRPAKLVYLFWLLAPVGFLPLLGAELLLVPAFALGQVMASTYRYHFEIFERYAAPIVPFVFLAALVGLERLRRRWPAAAGPAAALLLLCPLAAQVALGKLPWEVPLRPEPRRAEALALAHSLPEAASVSASDHRLLPHLAHRRALYYLSPTSPPTDYVLFDRREAPITNVPLDRLRQREAALLADPAYRALRCRGGLYLLTRLPAPPEPLPAARARFEGGIALLDVALDGRTVRLEWAAERPVGAAYQVFVHLLDGAGRLVAQHDGPPAGGDCPTNLWGPGLRVEDAHELPRLDGAELRVGLYRLDTLERVRRADAPGDAFRLALP